MESSKGLPEVQPIPGPRFTLHEISRFEELLRPLVAGKAPTNTNNVTPVSASDSAINGASTISNYHSNSNNNANRHTKSAYITPSYPSSRAGGWKGPSRSTALTRGVYGRPAAASLRSRDYILTNWNWNDGVCSCELCRVSTSTCTMCRDKAFNSYHKNVKGCDCPLCQKSNPTKHLTHGLLIDKEKDSGLLSLAFKSNTDNSNTTPSLGTAKSSSDNGMSNGSKLIFQTLQSLKSESKVDSAPSLPFTPVPITSRLARLSDAPPQKALLGMNETSTTPATSSITTSFSSDSSSPISFPSTFPSSSPVASTSFAFPPEPQSVKQTERTSTSFATTPTTTEKASFPLVNFSSDSTSTPSEPPAPLFKFPSSTDIFKPQAPEIKNDDSFQASSFFPAPSASPYSAPVPSASQASGSRQKRRKDVDDEAPAKKMPSFSFGVETAQSAPSFNFDFTAGQSSSASTTVSSASNAPTFGAPLFSGSQVSSFANSFDPSSFGSSSDSSSFGSTSFGGSFSSSAFPSLSAPPSDFGSFKSSGKAVKERKYASRKNLDAGMKLYEPENDGEFMPQDDDDDDGVVEVHSD